MNKAETDIMEQIPSGIDTEKTLQLISNATKPRSYFSLLKAFTGEDDEKLSGWLDMSVKTFRDYRDNASKQIKESVKEHLIVIISLMKHGSEVFGDYAKFREWLEKENFYFDKRRPIEYMSSISGMKFIDDRITALEYGDNA
jgi:uncharacterized protein (DUF2384 family)